MRSSNHIGGLDFESPILELENKIAELTTFAQSTAVDLSEQIEKLRNRCDEKKKAIFSNLNPWQRVQIARHPNRPGALDYIELLSDEHTELHGDRSFGDDPSIITALATVSGVRMLIVGQHKGKETAEKVACHFGSPHPEGYRKALRKMKLAEKFSLPILTLINTPGAYPGIGAEERGQAFVIARNLMEMASLRVPVLSVVIGEGGSGGALGIGVANRLLMLEHAYYSVISPEGCAAILWRSAEYKELAADILKLTALDLFSLGIVDEILPEPLGGAHRDHGRMAKDLQAAVLHHLRELSELSGEELVQNRYEKFRRIGVFDEGE